MTRLEKLIKGGAIFILKLKKELELIYENEKPPLHKTKLKRNLRKILITTSRKLDLSLGR
jgi:hypothetical protein